MSVLVVGVREAETGKVRVCAKADMPGNYHTLCGCSLDDDMFVEAPTRLKKVTCEGCFAVWREAQLFKRSDFTE